MSVLGRFLQSANAAGVRVALSALSEGLRIGLGRSLPPSVYDELLVEPDVDGALERCEDIVIEAWNTDVDMADERRSSLLDHAADDLERYLERQMAFENLIEELQRYLSPHEYSSGEAITGSDASQEDLQLLLSGRASGYDAAGTRLFQFGPGNAIWPAGAPDQRAASVVADESCRTMVLTPVARDWLEEREERLALKLYRYLLGGRLQVEQRAEEDQ